MAFRNNCNKKKTNECLKFEGFNSLEWKEFSKV